MLQEQSLEAMPVFITVPLNGSSGVWRCVSVCERQSFHVCSVWRKQETNTADRLSSLLHHLHCHSLPCLSDAGDGGQAVRWFLEFLRLCGGRLRDGAKAEWQSYTASANVAWAQRWILPSIAFHNAGCVGCKAFPCSVQHRKEEAFTLLIKKVQQIQSKFQTNTNNFKTHNIVCKLTFWPCHFSFIFLILEHLNTYNHKKRTVSHSVWKLSKTWTKCIKNLQKKQTYSHKV